MTGTNGEMICIIPAKGNSSRCPRKNKRDFFGTPMLAYSIETARKSGLFVDTIVSTDDGETAKIATTYGARAMARQPGWDELGTQELAGEILKSMDSPPQFAAVIYATAPLLDVSDLLFASTLWHRRNFMLSVGTEPLRDAASFYFGLTKDFVNRAPLLSAFTQMYPLMENRVCDINTPDDLARAEKMYAKLHGIDMRLTAK